MQHKDEIIAEKEAARPAEPKEESKILFQLSRENCEALLKGGHIFLKSKDTGKFEVYAPQMPKTLKDANASMLEAEETILSHERLGKARSGLISQLVDDVWKNSAVANDTRGGDAPEYYIADWQDLQSDIVATLQRFFMQIF